MNTIEMLFSIINDTSKISISVKLESIWNKQKNIESLILRLDFLRWGIK